MMKMAAHEDGRFLEDFMTWKFLEKKWGKNDVDWWDEEDDKSWGVSGLQIMKDHRENLSGRWQKSPLELEKDARGEVGFDDSIVPTCKSV